MNRENWLVGDFGVRPSGRPDECFYCHAKIGEQHKEDCVIRERTVKLRLTIDYVSNVPEFWDEDHINFYYNEGTWCADNVLNALAERSEEVRCLCDVAEIEYIGEATKEDENIWGLVRVKELES